MKTIPGYGSEEQSVVRAPERWVANHWIEASEDLAEDERLFQTAKRKQQRVEHRKKKRKGKG